jgi:hypothetical protein
MGAEIKITNPTKTCMLGRGVMCCVFLVMAPTGFKCAKGTEMEITLQNRLESGTTVPKGTGDWEECLCL